MPLRLWQSRLAAAKHICWQCRVQHLRRLNRVYASTQTPFHTEPDFSPQFLDSDVDRNRRRERTPDKASDKESSPESPSQPEVQSDLNHERESRHFKGSPPETTYTQRPKLESAARDVAIQSAAAQSVAGSQVQSVAQRKDEASAQSERSAAPKTFGNWLSKYYQMVRATAGKKAAWREADKVAEISERQGINNRDQIFRQARRAISSPEADKPVVQREMRHPKSPAQGNERDPFAENSSAPTSLRDRILVRAGSLRKPHQAPAINRSDADRTSTAEPTTDLSSGVASKLQKRHHASAVSRSDVDRRSPADQDTESSPGTALEAQKRHDGSTMGADPCIRRVIGHKSAPTIRMFKSGPYEPQLTPPLTFSRGNAPKKADETEKEAIHHSTSARTAQLHSNAADDTQTGTHLVATDETRKRTTPGLAASEDDVPPSSEHPVSGQAPAERRPRDAPDESTDKQSSVAPKSTSRGRKRKAATGETSPMSKLIATPLKKTSPVVKLSKRAQAKARAEYLKTTTDFGTFQQYPLSKEAVSVNPESLPFVALDIPKPPIPKLAHKLDRVLFNRGINNLQDPYSGVYNFDPYLENIMPVDEFDWTAIKEYKTSSQDQDLAAIAANNQARYVGSTSSMTSMLTHFHYLLSHWRGLNHFVLSNGFKLPSTGQNFTEVYRAPASIFLRWKNGIYAIDADKEFGTPHILMALGNSLEKLLTLSPDEFERYRKGDSRGVSNEERSAPQAYHYSKQGNILMRSQLDAYDARLPGTGVFDLKTRAVLPIRMSSTNYEDMTGYQIISDFGTYESYEREVFDMFRSTCLKYSLQVRMGRMEGIFMAYHNIREIFGFQFMNLSSLDRVLHGQEDTCLGDQEFRVSLELVQKILDEATAALPEQSLRFHFETNSGTPPTMNIFAEPMTEEEIEQSQEEAEHALKVFEADLRGQAKDAIDEGEGDAPGLANEEADVLTQTSDHIEQQPDQASGVVDATASELPDTGTDLETAASPTTEPPSAEKSSSPTNPAPRKEILAWTLQTNNTVNNHPVERPEDLRPSDHWEVTYELQRIKKPQTVQALFNAVRNRRKTILARDDEVDGDWEAFRAAKKSAMEAGGEAAKSAADMPSDMSTEQAREATEGLKGLTLKEALAGSVAAAQVEEKAVSRKSSKIDGYRIMLQGLSKKGRKIRERRLKRAEGKEKMLVDEDTPDNSRLSARRTDTVEEAAVVENVDDYMDLIYGRK